MIHYVTFCIIHSSSRGAKTWMPDKEFWRRLEEYLGFEREHTMFVDDSIPVLNAAVEFGIGGVVAIRKPASGMPANDTEGHHSIDGVGFWDSH